MTQKIKNILRGVGSVIDVSPKTDFSRFVSKQTPAERMSGHWRKTGDQIRAAMNQVSDAQKTRE